MPLTTIVSARLSYHPPARNGVILAVYGALVVLLVFTVGFLLNPLGGFLAGLAVLVASFSTPDYQGDSGYCILVLLTAAILVWRARSPSAGRSALLAAAVGASLLWRSPLLFLTPALALWEWATEYRFSLKACREHVLILFIVPYLFLLPWIAMNWTIHREVVIVERGAASSNVVTGALGLVGDIEGDLKTIVDEPIDTAKTKSVLGWAIRQVIRHPLRFARAYILRIKYALSFNPLAALFALVGIWVYRERREYRALSFMAAYFLGIYCLMAVEERYFWPLWPLLAVLACSLPVGIFARDRPRDDAPEVLVASVLLKTVLAIVVVLSLYANWELLSFANLVRRGGRSPEVEFLAALRSNPDDIWLLSQLGGDRLDRGDLGGAAGDFSRAAALSPNDHSLQLDLARIEALQGKPDRLFAWSADDPTAGDLQINADILKACAYQRLGRKSEAIAHLKAAREEFRSRHIVVRGPQDEHGKRVLDELGASDAGFVEIFRALQGPMPAADKLAMNDVLVESSSRASEVWLERAELEREVGNLAEAIKCAALAEARGLDTDEQRWSSIRLYRRLKDFGRAFAQLRRLSLRHPDEAEPAIEMAETAAEMGRRDEARELLIQAEKLRLDDDEQRRRVLRLCLEFKEFSGAAAQLEVLSRGSPDDAGLLIARAELALEMGERGAAHEFLLQAGKRQLSGDEERRRLIRLYREFKENGQASALTATLLRRHPGDAGLLIERAELAAEMGRRDEALGFLARAEKARPGDDHDGERWRRIALVYQDFKEYGRAVDILARLTRQFPAAASFYGDKGLCEHLMGAHDAAIADLRTAIRLDPTYLPAYLTLGASFAAQGRFQEAIKVYDEALNTNSPGRDPLLSVLISARGDLLSRGN